MTNQEELLSAFKNERIIQFKNLVRYRKDVEVDYFYGEPDNGTLLDLACRSQEKKKYVKLLLEEGAKVWHKDEKTGKFKLHEILKNQDLWSIFWRAVYRSSDYYGRVNANVMEMAVEENDLEAIELLAHSYSVGVPQSYSKENNSKSKFIKWFREHPLDIHLILLQGSIDAVRLFIKYFDVDMELQTDSLGRVFSCREVILQKYPELEVDLPTQSLGKLHESLFFYLEKGHPELFVRRIAEINAEILNEGKQKESMFTYVHVACERNYIGVVDALLKKWVHLNELAYFDESAQNVTPIMLAAFKGHCKIFKKLLAEAPAVQLESDGGSGSVFHSIVHGMHFMQNRNCSIDGHRKILEYLEHQLPGNTPFHPLGLGYPFFLDSDYTDENNNTALHYALKYNNEFAIKLLLDAGATLYPKDGAVLTWISAKIVEGYFDDCILSSREFPSTRDHKESSIIFRYGIFSQLDLLIATKRKKNIFTRFEPIIEFRKLFAHPLTKSLLYLKWRLVRKYYYIYLTFYLLFCLSLSTYIFQIQQCVTSSTNSNGSTGSGSTDRAINRDASPILCDVSLWMWAITLLLYIVLILRELFQFSVSIRRYFGIPENWLEITTIVVVGFLFADDSNTHSAAIAILISWIGLILLLGKLPSLSIYIEMFKTVASNFAKLLLLYSILVASFAYSFFILFRNKISGRASSQNQTNVDAIDRTNENSVNSWQDLQMSFIKSIIMMTGEFEASTLPLDSNFSCGHVFLILFVFLISMVLYNLLNGLAVSDTRGIMEDAELVALISRAKIISDIERLGLSIQFHPAFKCRKVYAFLRNKLFYKVLFDETNLVCVYPTKNNRIEIEGQHFGKMPSTIVRHAEEIVEKREQSKLAKNENENSLTDVAKNNPSDSEHQSVCEQIRSLKLEVDSKISAHDEKLLQNVDQRSDKMMNKLLDEKISDLKLEIDAKNVARDEKLLQNVDQRFDKMHKLLEFVLQEVNFLKNKD
ncbi:transient receptor potential channel pyrexia-like [Planococcus citri]|uniref:transient receptor potential channel pyrexia-like n=1 Tax=Planococcus citri TaxID=170843 RepID=UPI0031FA233D